MRRIFFICLFPLLAVAFSVSQQKPNYVITPETIKIGKAILAFMPQVADPKTHDSAVVKMERTKAAIKSETTTSDADAAVLDDLISLYTFATYMYDTRDHWMKLDPQIKTHPQNLFLLRPYSDCWQKVRGELETGIAQGVRSVGCDLSVIGER